MSCPASALKADENSSEFPSASTNPCKLCTPLGACLAFKGIAGAVPLLHGSQGCATYIRRYLISHFREPVDIASTNFSEDAAVFGGRKNLHTALDNVGRQYRPALVGIATTCLSETMGENMPMLIGEYGAEARDLPAAVDRPALVHVSTPSFKGTHADGFHATVRALVETLAEDCGGRAGPPGPPTERTARRSVPTGAPGESNKIPVAIFSNMVSPADLRHLRDLCSEWGTGVTLVPDYSETLDGPSWADFERTPAGGTTVAELRALGGATAAIELGHVLARAEHTAGTHLKAKFNVPAHRIGLPIGVRACDEFSAAMAAATGREMPRRVALDRGRLVDSYVDAHKYLAGKKAVVYGEEDLVAGLAVFLAETGIVPVLCASGGRTKHLAEAIFAAAPELRGRAEVREGSDFGDIEARVAGLKPDLLIGSSKGYRLARSLGVPLVRCGFPVHDRIGAQRIRLLGYAGTQELFDRIVNAVLEAKQEDSEIGYSYL
jgi:nitrogenase molybdenum-iron protein NifN